MALLLFVDDDPFTLEVLAKATQVLGHQAIVASNGQEALKLASEHSLDLIFVDMQLPDMDGTTLVSQFQNQESTACVPLFILSASPREVAAQEAQAAGARGYLDKPIRLQTLLKIIQEYTTG